MALHDWLPSDRRVDLTFLPHGCEVSTVETGVAPLAFETAVFFPGMRWTHRAWRYSSRAEALDGHQRVVAFCRGLRGGR